MKRILSTDVKKFNGQTVTVAGWVHAIRDVGHLVFLVLRDRAGKLQVICKEERAAATARSLHSEDVVTVKGKVVVDEKIKMGGVEIACEEITILSRGPAKLAVDIAGKTETNFEHRFDHRVLDLRREQPQAIFHVQSTLCNAFRSFMLKNDFLEVHTPKIISTGTEGGTALFPVKYFEKSAFLAQSPQFYKQMLVGAGFERVFEISPVFRAEEHNTPWHLNEYISLDMEMGFIDDEEDVIKLASDCVKYMVKKVIEENEAELKLFNVQLAVPKKIPVVPYWDLPKILGKGIVPYFDDVSKSDLTRQHEELLCQYAKEKYGTDFIFINNYPAEFRPAYTQLYAYSGKKRSYSRGFDLLFNGVEIISGGQRVHDVQLLEQRLKEKGFNPQDFEFYLEVFRNGMPPHGGLAFGLERLTARLLGLQNVREAAFFPRDRNRITP